MQLALVQATPPTHIPLCLLLPFTSQSALLLGFNALSMSTHLLELSVFLLGLKLGWVHIPSSSRHQRL
jgi:hypothetical protein